MTDLTDIDELWSVAEALADVARVETLAHFRSRDLQADSKTEAFDPVTVADRSTEAAMRAILAERRPDDGILGEEHENVSSRSGLTWVLDPIDGTRGYISGTPTWGVLVALADEAGPRLGLIDQPYIGERFLGGQGRSEMTGPLGKRSLRASSVTELADATLFTTFPEVGSQDECAAFQRVAAKTKLTRYGYHCDAYALLAAGHVDLVIEAGLQPYDIQAPIAVIEAAGGVLTDWTGAPAHKGGTAIAAATQELHAAALALLSG